MTRLGLFLALLGTTACAGPSLPSQLPFGQFTYGQLGSWSRDGFTGAVYVQPGEGAADASQAIGVIIASDTTAEELQQWILGEYESAVITSWHHEALTPTEACKIGEDFVSSRRFVAVHACRAQDAVAACVEVDQKINPEIVRCDVAATACWERLCDVRIGVWRVSLNRALDYVLTPR